MRLLVVAGLLAVFATPAPAAERVTASDGTAYTRAADGKYYPSQFVRSDGSVSTTPVSPAPQTGGTPLPWVVAPLPGPGAVPCPTCPNGRCPAPSLLPPSVIR
jgi:hypothetical protein